LGYRLFLDIQLTYEVNIVFITAAIWMNYCPKSKRTLHINLRVVRTKVRILRREVISNIFVFNGRIFKDMLGNVQAVSRDLKYGCEFLTFAD
jgi:hypothetical protein